MAFGVACLIWFICQEYIKSSPNSSPEVLFNVQSVDMTVNNKRDPIPTNDDQLVNQSLVNNPNSTVNNICVVNEPNPPAEADPTTKQATPPCEDDGGETVIPHIDSNIYGEICALIEDKLEKLVEQNDTTVQFDEDQIVISGSNAANRKVVEKLINDSCMVQITLPINDTTTWDRVNKLKKERKITILESILRDGTVQSVTIQGQPRFCRQFFF